MTPTHVELYEALKPSIGEDAARMIAEAFPAAADLATKQDLEALQSEMREGFTKVYGEMHTLEARLLSQIHAETSRTIKWFIGVFVPVLAATWGTMLAVVLRS